MRSAYRNREWECYATAHESNAARHGRGLRLVGCRVVVRNASSALQLDDVLDRLL